MTDTNVLIFDGAVLEATREAKGWTASCLANKLGVSPSSVRMWERGLKRPRLGQVKKLCRLLGVSREQLQPQNGVSA